MVLRNLDQVLIFCPKTSVCLVVSVWGGWGGYTSCQQATAVDAFRLCCLKQFGIPGIMTSIHACKCDSYMIIGFLFLVVLMADKVWTFQITKEVNFKLKWTTKSTFHFSWTDFFDFSVYNSFRLASFWLHSELAIAWSKFWSPEYMYFISKLMSILEHNSFKLFIRLFRCTNNRSDLWQKSLEHTHKKMSSEIPTSYFCHLSKFYNR